jgi:type II secretory ATPase GspE/PulE/Tfp pilus assembly ATPase PilB-like protein
MLSSEGKPTDIETIGKPVLPDTELQWHTEPQRGQIFQLIESLLSFEACLYHQILPLRFEDKSLILGMVNESDDAALDYVNRILSYINCTSEIQLMAADTHRGILSAYLNHKNTSQPNIKEIPLSDLGLSPDASTITITPTTPPVVDDSVECPEESPKAVSHLQTHQQTVQTSESTPTHKHSSAWTDTDPNTAAHNVIKSEKKADTATFTAKIPILSVPAQEQLSPVELLPTLPPKKFLEELLGRVIVGGIGRLYFERLPYEGKVLWSENGVLQSVLEKLPLSVFQGALNELKRFAGLSIATLSEPKQIEKEYLYQEQRLLLRLRVMPGMYGEEATLQVLRGAALKFYQQQQLARLGRDALSISQQLSYKLHEMQKRLLLNRNTNNEHLESLTALNRLIDNLDSQIKNLSLNDDNSINKGSRE